jgi:hypothetical protein
MYSTGMARRTPAFTKHGPKRLRRTRRELPYGQVSLWAASVYHAHREREATRAATDMAEALAYTATPKEEMK